MVTTDPKTDVDISPIVVTEIVVDGRRLVAREPLRFEVTYEEEDGEAFFALEGEFGITLAAEMREELEDILEDTLHVFWREFAQEDPGRMTSGAWKLREELLQRFTDVRNAAQVS